MWGWFCAVFYDFVRPEPPCFSGYSPDALLCNFGSNPDSFHATDLGLFFGLAGMLHQYPFFASVRHFSSPAGIFYNCNIFVLAFEE